jgi:hypothetical protein
METVKELSEKGLELRMCQYSWISDNRDTETNIRIAVLKKETCGTEQNRMVPPVQGENGREKIMGGKED